jgi:hypothetical protein
MVVLGSSGRGRRILLVCPRFAARGARLAHRIGELDQLRVVGNNPSSGVEEAFGLTMLPVATEHRERDFGVARVERPKDLPG